MGTLRNGDIYQPHNPRAKTVMDALSDLLSQRVPGALGMKLRAIKRTIETQAQDISEVHKEILERYPEQDGKRTEEQIQSINDEYAELLDLEFECELLTTNDVKNLSLEGWTYTSPLIVDNEPEKVEAKTKNIEE